MIIDIKMLNTIIRKRLDVLDGLDYKNKRTEIKVV